MSSLFFQSPATSPIPKHSKLSVEEQDAGDDTAIGKDRLSVAVDPLMKDAGATPKQEVPAASMPSAAAASDATPWQSVPSADDPAWMSTSGVLTKPKVLKLRKSRNPPCKYSSS